MAETGETGGSLQAILSHIELRPQLLDSDNTYSALISSLNNGTLNSALSPDLGPVLNLQSVENNYGNFIANFGGGYTSSGGSVPTRAAQVTQSQLESVDLTNNMKLSLAMLDKSGLPTQLGLTPSESPLTKAFPEVEYNLATFSIYL